MRLLLPEANSHKVPLKYLWNHRENENRSHTETHQQLPTSWRELSWLQRPWNNFCTTYCLKWSKVEVPTTAISSFQQQTLAGLPIHSVALGHPYEGTWKHLVLLQGTHGYGKPSFQPPPSVNAALELSRTVGHPLRWASMHRATLDRGKRSTHSGVLSFPDTFSRCFLLIYNLRGRRWVHWDLKTPYLLSFSKLHEKNKVPSCVARPLLTEYSLLYPCRGILWSHAQLWSESSKNLENSFLSGQSHLTVRS